MKKLLIATLMAVVGTAASAQVTLSGKVGLYAENAKVGGADRNSVVTEPTSNFAITATEKLGNGLSARAVVETSVQGNTIDGDGTRLGDRQGTVGVATRLGSLDLGRNVHGHFLALTSNDAFSTLYGSVAGDVHNLRGLRLSNGVFASMTPMKNVRVGLDATNGVNVYSLGGSMKNLNLSLARFDNNNERSDVFGARANLGATTVFYTHSDDRGLVTSKGNLVGATHKVGPWTAKASYGKTDRDVRAYALGVDYAMSKRTSLGVAFNDVDRVGVAGDVRRVGLGVVHLF